MLLVCKTLLPVVGTPSSRSTCRLVLDISWWCWWWPERSESILWRGFCDVFADRHDRSSPSPFSPLPPSRPSSLLVLPLLASPPFSSYGLLLDSSGFKSVENFPSASTHTHYHTFHWHRPFRGRLALRPVHWDKIWIHITINSAVSVAAGRVSHCVAILRPQFFGGQFVGKGGGTEAVRVWRVLCNPVEVVIKAGWLWTQEEKIGQCWGSGCVDDGSPGSGGRKKGLGKTGRSKIISWTWITGQTIILEHSDSWSKLIEIWNILGGNWRLS